MKRILFGILFSIISGFAQAGFLVDSWKTGAPEEVCSWAAVQVGFAIDRRLVNVPFVFKDKTEIPPGTGARLRVPRDALYITSWDKLDALDKDFIIRLVRFGYEIAERKLLENPNAKFPDNFGTEYNKFMATCITNKNNHEEVFRLIKTASSESIKGIPIGSAKVGINERLFLCQELEYDIRTIARAISDGEPLEDMIALAKRSEPDLRPDRLTRILRQLPEAYAYKGPIIDWINKEYKDCIN